MHFLQPLKQIPRKTIRNGIKKYQTFYLKGSHLCGIYDEKLNEPLKIDAVMKMNLCSKLRRCCATSEKIRPSFRFALVILNISTQTLLDFSAIHNLKPCMNKISTMATNNKFRLLRKAFFYWTKKILSIKNIF